MSPWKTVRLAPLLDAELARPDGAPQRREALERDTRSARHELQKAQALLVRKPEKTTVRNGGPTFTNTRSHEEISRLPFNRLPEPHYYGVLVVVPPAVLRIVPPIPQVDFRSARDH